MARVVCYLLSGLVIGGAASSAWGGGEQVAPHAMPGVQPPAMDLSTYQGPKGKLAVHAVQGTKGGPAVTGDEVEVVLMHNKAPILRRTLHLDEQGLVIAEGLPVAMAVTPVVRVKHAGVYYQQTGALLDATKPSGSVEVTVYEVTPKTPDWKVDLRQMMFVRKDTGADVGETVIVENPSDTTWLGADADAQGRRATVTLTLPPGASDIQLEHGFHGWCCTAYTNNQLAVQMPLMPGKTTFQFGYTVPFTPAGLVDLRVSAPVTISHAAVYVPVMEGAIQATGMNVTGKEVIDNQPATLYETGAAGGVKPGEAVGVQVPALPVQHTHNAPEVRDPFLKIVTGAAVVLGLVGGVLVMRSIRKPH